MIDLKNLKSLIKLMVDNDLTELDLLDQQGERVTLKRGPHGQTHLLRPFDHTIAHAGVIPPSAPQPPGSPLPATPDPDAGFAKITSPMVGTFYTSASPEAKSFVAVGSKVTPDTVVCIIEAMKVFNEIKAETSGTIEKILVSNGQAVEFAQPLFLVKPA